MKRLSISLFALLFLLSGCDILDNQQPSQSVPLEGGYSSVENLDRALVGAYSDVQGGDVLGANYLLFPEIMADNTVWQGSFPTYVEISGRDIAVNNGTVELTWNETYESINDVNLIIDAINEGQVEGDQATLDQLRGESLFLRAVLHFEAVRMWGKPWGFTSDNSHMGIPVVTSGVIGEPDFQERSRNTVGEVYTQVTSDLTTAIDLLPPPDAQIVGRANNMNARAYLARVYLQQGNYANVASLTDAVISSGAYQLESSPIAYFQSEEESSESVWDIIQTVQDNPGVNAALPTFYDDSESGGRGDITVAGSYITALENATTDVQEASLPPGYSFEDLRATQLLSPDSSVTQKYPDGTNTADNAPVLRYADVLLMRAEALAEQAPDINSAEADEAIDLLNQIRLRSIRVYDATGAEDPGQAETSFGYDNVDFADTQELIDAILLERRVELAFEGQRMHDLQRREMPVRGVPYDADNIIWPIPQSEMDANSQIEQNPGY